LKKSSTKGSKMILFNIHDYLYYNTKVNEIIFGVGRMLWLFQHVAFGKIGKGKNPVAITIKNMQNFIVKMEVKTFIRQRHYCKQIIFQDFKKILKPSLQLALTLTLVDIVKTI